MFPALSRVPPAKVVAVLDSPEEKDASIGIEQHEEKHAHDDEEALEHRHHHGLHQHLQCGLQQGGGHSSITA